MICVSLGGIKFERALEISRRENLVEIRADLLKLNEKQLDQILDTPAKKVFTFRKSDVQDDVRLQFYRISLEKGVQYIDLDYSSDLWILENLRHSLTHSSTDLILSIHDYERTPSADELKKKIKELREGGADVVKIASMVNNNEDIVNLMGLYRTPGRKIIIGMGKKGMILRVAAIYMGAEFTFAAPENEKGTAPGQLSKKDIQEIISIMKPQ